MAAENLPDLPVGESSLLEHQVAGHGNIVTVEGDDEIIIKPCNETERTFYENAVAYPDFQLFMPHYYGSLSLTETADSLTGQVETPPSIQSMETNATPRPPPMPLEMLNQPKRAPSLKHAVCLENLLYGFSKPCIMDLKMGQRLYDDQASEAKRQWGIEAARSTTTGCLGLRISGIEVFDQDKCDYVQYSGNYGKSLTKDTIPDGFRAFLPLSMKQEYREFLIKEFTLALTEMIKVVEAHELRMYGSSLLFVYEGDSQRRDRILAENNLDEEDDESFSEEFDNDGRSSLPNTTDMEDSGFSSDDDEEEEEDDNMLYDLRIIDFAHSTWCPSQGTDTGFLFGVRNTRDVLYTVL
ncbi:hypothetical protein IWQ62_006277 [Dispira parvispora]|uniref:Kinase n=1 Tax=Dispira parvispora TaxID=1520584 RepID=A0A9W8ANC0_9FUNG|nr:hypothetical protein IWQ62_006277 [Dispira parvispora]